MKINKNGERKRRVEQIANMRNKTEISPNRSIIT